jgi:acylpyruvate hydrolase
MRLVTFQPGDQSGPRFGLLIGDRILDAAAAAVRQGLNGFPTTAIAFLAAGDSARQQAEALIANPDGPSYAAHEVTFLPPIPRPGKIICVGHNYRAHIVEMGRELPKFPVIFAKYANVLVGHEGNIVLPRVSEQVDYEAELAVVIGKVAKDVPTEHAFDYIAGYAPFNDVSVRDYQNRTTQFLQGKTFDTCGPMGPSIVTRDEIGEPHLGIRLRLNGQTMQESNTADLYFNIPTLIQTLTEIMTLEPGDVIATGTPGGVGHARKPPVYLKPGDVVEVDIDKLGTLRNYVMAPALA